jgi:diguanylate cyclase (GGDEF)-like protein
MDVNVVFLACVLLVHGLVTLVWWVGGTLLGLSRRAAWHWMIAAVANGAALSLLPLSQIAPLPAHLLVASVLVVHGLISMRRGLQGFLRLRHTDISHAALGVGVIIVNLGLCLPMGWIVQGEAISMVAVALLLGRTAFENHAPLADEFGPGVARSHTGVLGLAGLLFAGSALMVAVPTLHQAWGRLTPDVAMFALLAVHLLLSVAVSFLTGYMVVTRLVRKLQHLSHHDSLTGLLNRRAIEYLLARESQRLQRFGEQFSLLIIDIDHFKRINDRLGHAAGDAVLCAVAQALQAHAREVDRVARFGGEEFCALLPHTLHDGALLAAERLRYAINQISIPWSDEVIAVTISVGVATADHPSETLEALLKRADQALYKAKSEGRNRVVAAQAHLHAVG